VIVVKAKIVICHLKHSRPISSSIKSVACNPQTCWWLPYVFEKLTKRLHSFPARNSTFVNNLQIGSNSEHIFKNPLWIMSRLNIFPPLWCFPHSILSKIDSLYDSGVLLFHFCIISGMFTTS